MILAISRFHVANDKCLEIERAFVNRPRLVDNVPGFIGLEVFRDTAHPATFHLLTRWTDIESFRRWHSSPAHHTSHQGIPKGLKLDPSQTELLFLEPICDVGSPLSVSLVAWPELIAGFIAQSRTVSYIVADRSGTIRVASGGFAYALQIASEEVPGKSLFSFLSHGSAAALAAIIESGDRMAKTAVLTFCSPSGNSFTMDCRLDIQPDQFALVGSPRDPRTDPYMETLEDLNNRLAVEVRESTRRGKELERVNGRLQKALDELDTMYWHLRKIEEVLPICLGCGKVKTGESSWQTVIEYLKNNSRFLSHGYCPTCYERAISENA